MSDLPRVSVVVCTYRREEMMLQVVQALLRQDYPDFEVIVVDQTPTLSRTAECCLRSAPSLRYCHVDTPSLPGARNVGTSLASGDIVLFVDDDVEPGSRLIASHARAYRDPSVGGVAGRRTYPAGSRARDSGGAIGLICRRGAPQTNFSASVPAEVEFASGCNMSFRRRALELARGFERRFLGTAVFEEVDLCCRVRGLGYRIVFEPEADLVHLVAQSGGCSTRTEDTRYWYSWVHNSLLFALRNRSASGVATAIWEALLLTAYWTVTDHSVGRSLAMLSAFPRSALSHARSRGTRGVRPYPRLRVPTLVSMEGKSLSNAQG